MDNDVSTFSVEEAKGEDINRPGPEGMTPLQFRSTTSAGAVEIRTPGAWLKQLVSPPADYTQPCRPKARAMLRPVPDIILDRDSGSPRLGTNLLRQKTTVVLAHFIGHQLVQQGVHAQYEILVLFRIQGQIVRLERVIPQVKELEVVVTQNLLERYWRIEVVGGVVTHELILTVKREAHESAFFEL